MIKIYIIADIFNNINNYNNINKDKWELQCFSYGME